ncbi:endolytic transglycosylase MltG [Pollutimonas harenae]|uniref:Endolytic murein transglycosylase n=1 Tax=Pollutimonas harenae TaxID=657015 RepID=A0A853H204_9BURK|nr:endolytic transglycosylase MltG [Pollutimonas harenae]NYT86050.1 endolytic transglycosylase MltG [Pollutimonas harenae]TEA71098.1 endolytic transglycosylase MltG [Pollutimonas harenae]
MKKLKLFILYLLLAAALLATVVSAVAWYWVGQPVALDNERIDYLIEPGSRPRSIAQTMNKAGIHVNEDAFVILARLTGLDKQLQAGAYEAAQGDSPRVLLERMANGDMTQTRLTLLEGWSYKRIRQALRDDPKVGQTLAGVSDQELLKRLGSTTSSTEGLFYPDTYVFAPGTSDFDILRRAYHAQQKMLEELWSERDPNLPLETPYEALILASIVEKETGHSADRGRVAGVFINRLRLGMPLQTDPTVIYGMGDAYQGRIRKKDLTTDTPWNTYTRSGLPPTPIASPGRASILATLHPETHKFLYFVSRGDGTSEFSANLTAHNRAVAKYILKRGN